jgi:glycine/D-amino acid oxidase-like deaminating enzyme
MHADVVIIGAGIVGASVAYGLTRHNLSVLLIDGNDDDYNASHGNFGLVWLQGKGAARPGYQLLTRASIEMWPDFARELTAATGIDVEYTAPGGLHFCLNDQQFSARSAMLETMRGHLPDYDMGVSMLSRDDLGPLLPDIALGPTMAGASFCRYDGHVNPLRLHAALLCAVRRAGGRVLRSSTARRLRKVGASVCIATDSGEIFADRVLLAAGLGNRALCREHGFDLPIRPQRGQILVTERAAPVMPYPANTLRQTNTGSFLIGGTKEEVGWDEQVTARQGHYLARSALEIFPAFETLRLVRQWGALRIMTPDSAPIYEPLRDLPEAWVVACHSGITLAALHATVLADAIVDMRLPSPLHDFRCQRFDVQENA